MPDGTSLTGDAATVHRSDNIVVTDGVGEDEGLTDNELKCFQPKVRVNRLLVDDNAAGAGKQTHPRYRSFSATCSAKLNTSHALSSSPNL